MKCVVGRKSIPASILAVSAGLLGWQLPGCPGMGGNGVPGTTVSWTQIIIDDQPNVNPNFIVLADIDNDGDLDAASGFFTGRLVRIHLQQRLDDWRNFTIADQTEVGPINSLAIDDLDQANELDVVAAGDDGRLVLLLSPSFALPAENWQASQFTDPAGVNVSSWTDVQTADLDELNGNDIVACSQADGIIALFRSEAKVTSADDFRSSLIANSAVRDFSRMALADVDMDGDTDIVAIAPNAGIFWLENPGPSNVETSWTQRTINTRRNARRVAIGLIDDDNDIDVMVVVGGGVNSVIWYENLGSQRFSQFDEHIVASFTGTPDGVTLVDVDDNGTLDAIVSIQGVQPTLVWIAPFSDPRQQWVVQSIDLPGFNPGQVPAGNIDGVGRVDFATTLDGSPTPVVWYLQQ